MKRAIFTLAVLNIAFISNFAQKIIPYELNGKYGLRNEATGLILIYPKYNKIVDLSDSIIIVQSRDFKYGAIDTMDNILIPFSNEMLVIDKYNPFHYGEIMEGSNYKNDPKFYSI